MRYTYNKYHSDAVKRIAKFKAIYNYYLHRRKLLKIDLGYYTMDLAKAKDIKELCYIRREIYKVELNNIKCQLKHYSSLILKNKMSVKHFNRKYNKENNKQ